MIGSFRHKGLKLYFEKGDSSKLQPQHLGKIRNMLTRLHALKSIEQMNEPGYNLHQLKGDLEGFWSVKVDKNYRIIFRLIDDQVLDVDYIDYH